MSHRLGHDTWATPDSAPDTQIETRTRTHPEGSESQVVQRPRRWRLGAMSYQAGGFDAAQGDSERANAADSKKVLCLP